MRWTWVWVGEERGRPGARAEDAGYPGQRTARRGRCAAAADHGEWGRAPPPPPPLFLSFAPGPTRRAGRGRAGGRAGAAGAAGSTAGIRRCRGAGGSRALCPGPRPRPGPSRRPLASAPRGVHAAGRRPECPTKPPSPPSTPAPAAMPAAAPSLPLPLSPAHARTLRPPLRAWGTAFPSRGADRPRVGNSGVWALNGWSQGSPRRARRPGGVSACWPAPAWLCTAAAAAGRFPFVCRCVLSTARRPGPRPALGSAGLSSAPGDRGGGSGARGGGLCLSVSRELPEGLGGTAWFCGWKD